MKRLFKPDRCILYFTTWLETVQNTLSSTMQSEKHGVTLYSLQLLPRPGALILAHSVGDCSQLLQARHTKRWGRPELSQLLKHYLRHSPLALFTRILNTYHLCLLLFLLPFLASLFVNFVVTHRLRSPSGILRQLRSSRHGLFQFLEVVA